MASRVAVAVFFLCSNFWAVRSKIYDRCELARELRDVHEIPEEHLATWLCIVNYESRFNTSAHNPGSGDHGLFQISELYWCSPPGVGYACGLPCSALKDEDIEDDVICARRIYRQHQRISGDGFTAWVVYNLHCKNPSHVASFIQGCFDEENLVKYSYQPIYEAMNLPTMRIPMPTTPPPPVSSSYAPPFLPSVSIPPSFISSAPPTHRVPPTKTTFVKTTTKSAKFQEKTTLRSFSKGVTTAKPRFTVSTYKPLLNLSSTLTSSRSTIFTLPQTNFVTSNIKPSSSPKFYEISTYKPFSSTFAVPPESGSKLSFPQRPSKISTYTPLSSPSRTTPTSFTFTTLKPPLSQYRPFLNKFSSTFRSSQPPIKISSTTFRPLVTSSVKSTTPKSVGTFSTYKPFLNQFSKTSNPYFSATKTFATEGRDVSLIASPSTTSFKRLSGPNVFVSPKPPLVDNDSRSTKAPAVKSRETETPLPFTFKSGVEPFQFKRDEKVYAFVNKSGYAFAISSRGFKLFRTGE